MLNIRYTNLIIYLDEAHRSFITASKKLRINNKLMSEESEQENIT